MTETSPYLDILRGHDDHESELQRTIKDRGRMALGLVCLLALSIYGNVYLLRKDKVIPLIHTVDVHGQVVTTLLKRPEEIAEDDPYRQAAARRIIMDWVENARLRSADRKVMAAGINSALRITKGPGLLKLRTDIIAEDVFKGIEKEVVEVQMPKLPIYLDGGTWLAEWEEITTNRLNVEISRKQYRGRFQIAQQDEWVSGINAYGLGIVSWSREVIAK